MKKVLLLSLMLVTLFASAQDKFSPSIVKNTKLSYVAHTGGQEVPFSITIDSLSPDYLKLAWSIEGMGNGGWIMKKNSLEKATRGYWTEPVAGTDQELADEQSILVFSKAQWNSIQKDKKAEFDQQTFSVKQPSDQQYLKLNGKLVDAILLESENGSTRLWILNNPSLPMILKLEGNMNGVDFEVRSVE